MALAMYVVVPLRRNMMSCIGITDLGSVIFEFRAEGLGVQILWFTVLAGFMVQGTVFRQPVILANGPDCSIWVCRGALLELGLGLRV